MFVTNKKQKEKDLYRHAEMPPQPTPFKSSPTVVLTALAGQPLWCASRIELTVAMVVPSVVWLRVRVLFSFLKSRWLPKYLGIVLQDWGLIVLLVLVHGRHTYLPALFFIELVIHIISCDHLKFMYLPWYNYSVW